MALRQVLPRVRDQSATGSSNTSLDVFDILSNLGFEAQDSLVCMLRSMPGVLSVVRLASRAGRSFVESNIADVTLVHNDCLGELAQSNRWLTLLERCPRVSSVTVRGTPQQESYVYPNCECGMCRTTQDVTDFACSLLDPFMLRASPAPQCINSITLVSTRKPGSIMPALRPGVVSHLALTFPALTRLGLKGAWLVPSSGFYIALARHLPNLTSLDLPSISLLFHLPKLAKGTPLRNLRELTTSEKSYITPEMVGLLGTVLPALRLLRCSDTHPGSAAVDVYLRHALEAAPNLQRVEFTGVPPCVHGGSSFLTLLAVPASVSAAAWPATGRASGSAGGSACGHAGDGGVGGGDGGSGFIRGWDVELSGSLDTMRLVGKALREAGLRLRSVHVARLDVSVVGDWSTLWQPAIAELGQLLGMPASAAAATTTTAAIAAVNTAVAATTLSATAAPIAQIIAAPRPASTAAAKCISAAARPQMMTMTTTGTLTAAGPRGCLTLACIDQGGGAGGAAATKLAALVAAAALLGPPRTLQLDWSQRPSDMGLLRLIAAGGLTEVVALGLEEVELVGCAALTPSILARLLALMPAGLRRLRVVRCARVSSDAHVVRALAALLAIAPASVRPWQTLLAVEP